MLSRSSRSQIHFVRKGLQCLLYRRCDCEFVLEPLQTAFLHQRSYVRELTVNANMNARRLVVHIHVICVKVLDFNQVFLNIARDFRPFPFLWATFFRSP